MKDIRPLTAFKKENPAIYDLFIDPLKEGLKGSKKQQENEFYWNYCFYESGINTFKGKIYDKARKNDPVWQFFFRDEHTQNHKAIITELGRLLLAGWYYNIEDFTKDICRHVYNGYIKANEHNRVFNEMEARQAVKHIRNNIGYYYHNQEELKIYLLETMFPEEVKKYLPAAPEELQNFKEITSVLKKEKERNLKQDKDHYYKLADIQEHYIEHLQGLLEQHGINFLSLEEYQDQDRQLMQQHIDRVETAFKKYEEEKKKALLSCRLLT